MRRRAPKRPLAKADAAIQGPSGGLRTQLGSYESPSDPRPDWTAPLVKDETGRGPSSSSLESRPFNGLLSNLAKVYELLSCYTIFIMQLR
jgi:hypothetical protein